MTIIVALHHVTHYRYARAITLGMQTIRLRPAPHTRSHIQAYSLKVQPQEHFLNWQQDPFGNYLARIVFPEKVRELRVEVDLITQIRAFNPFDFFLEDYAKDFPFRYEAALQEELAPYFEIKENSALLESWLKGISREKQGVVDFLVGVNQKLCNELQYMVRLDPGVQTCEQTLTAKSGSCRDMAWLLCQLLRRLGFATRFASGYLIQLKADVKSLDGPSGAKEDFTDLHAWTEVYLPGAGWVGLDPTSGLFTGEGHIPLCCTPNPSSAAPVSGTLEPCETTFDFQMRITRIEEPPRVTRPYTDSQWQDIDALGHTVEKALYAQDVRLTMGGEPTFVSLDDREGDEWNFTALSDTKKRLGNDLFLRLRKCFAPGGLVQYTQGKWYPGEILPRWAMHSLWRKDGEPVWSNEALLAHPARPSKYSAGVQGQFLTRLAELLGIGPEYVLPAFEDSEYYAWKEKNLPVEGDGVITDAYEKAERERVRALKEKMTEPSGYVLPLHYSYRRKRWISNAWRFRSGRMVLVPGDSPVGLRLPLGSLPHVEKADEEFCPPRSLFEQVDPLPSHSELIKSIAGNTAKKAADSFADDPTGLIRSAVSAELRAGVLYVFLPPLIYLEHFLVLVSAVEKVAEEMGAAVVLEGYPPPADQRIRQFSVTPDPGVLEVNIHPASNWDELKTILMTVYEQAKETRLTAEKFLVDGRRVGTGGGNHIVVGAALPEDSPFLRRPDVLKSLLAFWQNHPSLSYLFSSMYVGPTSQSPRIDEARNDSLYELGIAFEQLENIEQPVSPWLVDRLFRNLLIDLTGNTHRAEFCIDKLYSPDSERGRLGLLEMRGFEMTPHPQMNLLQALLVRACIAHFWKHPYPHKLIRWGTSLHDKFMLPYCLRENFHDVLHLLKVGGFRFAPEWFEPFFAFRFPQYGVAQVGAVTLELHMALEPWPVMGEEMQAGSVSRSVDSSVERLQVTVRGAVDERHVITCNGRRLPLMRTAEKGVYVAGVRYKAWAPSSALHPTIPVHTPLVFDLFDTHLERSLGGCVYHTVHPGGRSYDTIPINENEAEGRRLSRFEAMGHRPGHGALPHAETNPDFPYTLDLRF